MGNAQKKNKRDFCKKSKEELLEMLKTPGQMPADEPLIKAKKDGFSVVSRTVFIIEVLGLFDGTPSLTTRARKPQVPSSRTKVPC